MKISPVPKWILEDYSILWNQFKTKEFTHADAEKFLKIKNISIIISKLKKAGWLLMSLDPEDSRKRIYNLLPPEKIITNMKK